MVIISHHGFHNNILAFVKLRAKKWFIIEATHIHTHIASSYHSCIVCIALHRIEIGCLRFFICFRFWIFAFFFFFLWSVNSMLKANFDGISSLSHSLARAHRALAHWLAECINCSTFNFETIMLFSFSVCFRLKKMPNPWHWLWHECILHGSWNEMKSSNWFSFSFDRFRSRLTWELHKIHTILYNLLLYVYIV